MEQRRTRSDAQILIVEDEGLIARHLKQTLEQLGYTVVGIASSGQEALELLSLVSADLTLMDIKIRGAEDGVSTAESIRQRFDIPVVYLTSHADPATLDRAQRTHPFGYVVKPFTTIDLQVAIEIALNRYRLQTELREKEAWLRTVLQSIGDAIVVTDCDGTVKFINAAAEQLTGWCCVEAPGKPLQEVVQININGCDEKAEELPLGINQPEACTYKGILCSRGGAQHSVTGTTTPIYLKETEQIHGSVLILRRRQPPDLLSLWETQR